MHPSKFIRHNRMLRTVTAASILLLIVLFVYIAPSKTPKDNTGQIHAAPFSVNFADNQKDAIAYVNFMKDEEEFQAKIGRKTLDDVDDVMRQNSELLPDHSPFSTTQSICEGEDAANCAPKFGVKHSMLYFVPHKNLLTCSISKNMSTILRAIFCYLYNPKKFVATGRLIHKEQFGERFCKNGNEMWTTDFPKYIRANFHKNETEIFEEWQPFAMIRDPLERFMSAYTDKCIRRPISTKDYCNGCQKNLTCFVETELQRIKVTATEQEKTYEDHHFLPQSWECNFNQYFDQYEKVHYDSTDLFGNIRRLIGVLGSRGVADTELEYISFDVSANRTLHTTVGTRVRDFFERRLRQSAYLMEHVVRMYYWDYKLFGYDMPKIQYRSKESDTV